MATTNRRLTLALTKGDIEQLEFLKDHYGESTNQIYKRALFMLHQYILEEKRHASDNTI